MACSEDRKVYVDLGDPLIFLNSCVVILEIEFVTVRLWLGRVYDVRY